MTMTLIIEGGDRWLIPPREAERAKMAGYIARIGDAPGRCHDCAFRAGSAACLGDENNTFCCHHGEADRACAGFVALRQSYGVEATTEGA